MPDSGIAITPNGTAWRRAGEGPALVLIHGVGMNARIWAPQIAAFVPDRTVIAYDMLGHGGSSLPPEAPTLADYAAQLLGLLDYLGIGRAAVVGHSMGALVALQCALEAPARVSRLVAMNGVYCRTPEQRAAVEHRAAAFGSGGAGPDVAGTVDRWFGAPVPEALRAPAARAAGLLAQADPVGYARSYRLFATADRAHEGRLQHLAMPALFVTGELDPNSTPAMSQAMAAEAPRGLAAVLSGERHMMAVASPERVNARLRAFLDAAEG